MKGTAPLKTQGTIMPNPMRGQRMQPNMPIKINRSKEIGSSYDEKTGHRGVQHPFQMWKKRIGTSDLFQAIGDTETNVVQPSRKAAKQLLRSPERGFGNL